MSANHPITRDTARVMNRFDLISRMVRKLHREEAVIGGIGYSNFDLWAAERRPQNFYMLGSMGLACPIAFGVALAQPQRRVIALEGDGSMLMQLGSLSTIAAQRPRNLTIVLRAAGGLGAGHRSCRDGARCRIGAKRVGGGRGRFRGADRPRAGRGWAVGDRLPDRQRKAARDHRARPGADPRSFHARPRREDLAAGLTLRDRAP